ncbi:MAG: type III pantothenate kinase [Proteobacteria bacterium]|nr:type III pantothenate kinase [Pseudomonadota bacterium]
MRKDLAILLDIGNTSTKIGLCDRKRVVGETSVPTRGKGSANWGAAVDGLLARAGVGMGRVGSVVVSSVVPERDLLAGELAGWLQAVPLFVPGDLRVDIENRYERPEEVGADRLVGAFAVRRLYPEAERIVVVDFGTATTFDCVVGGAYLGGLICPGVLSSTRSLSEETAKLPKATLEIDTAGLRLGRSTLDSLNQGLVYGFAAMVEGLVVRISVVLGGEAKVIATGGFAERIASVCPVIDEVRGDLLMQGLRLAWVDGKGRENV